MEKKGRNHDRTAEKTIAQRKLLPDAIFARLVLAQQRQQRQRALVVLLLLRGHVAAAAAGETPPDKTIKAAAIITIAGACRQQLAGYMLLLSLPSHASYDSWNQT